MTNQLEGASPMKDEYLYLVLVDKSGEGGGVVVLGLDE